MSLQLLAGVRTHFVDVVFVNCCNTRADKGPVDGSTTYVHILLGWADKGPVDRSTYYTFFLGGRAGRVLAMPPPLSLYIPVVCQQEDSKYNGKCFMEVISKVHQFNVSTSADCSLVKADFSTGDEVIIRFSGKDFLSVVDLSLDGQSTVQHLPAESFLDSPGRPATLPTPRSTYFNARVVVRRHDFCYLRYEVRKVGRG